MFSRSLSSTSWNELALPLSFLAGDESLEDGHNLVQALEVDAQVRRNLGGVVTELGVEILAVWGGAHGRVEEGLDDEAVMGLQGRAVGGAEGVGEFLGLLGDVGAEADAGEFKATVLEVMWLAVGVSSM